MAINFLKRNELTNSRKLANAVGLGFPFKKSAGGYLRKDQNFAAIKGQVKQILRTERGERVMLPDFGVKLKQFLFEPLDQNTTAQIKESIVYALAKYAKDVEVINIDVFEDTRTGNEDLSAIVVRVEIAWIFDPLRTTEVEVSIG